MSRPPTILFVDHASALGGAELSLLGLLEALDRARYRPLLACRPGPLALRAGELGLPVVELPLARLKRSPAAPWRWLRGVLALAALARREEAALLHANVLRAAVYAAPAAALTGRPLVWHVRDLLPPGPVSRLLCRRAAAVVAISEAVAAALPCRDRARVIHNPVAAPTLAAGPSPGAGGRGSAERRRALGLPETGPLVASVGRLRPWKGHHRFLAAAAEVAPLAPEAHFLVIGGRVFTEDARDRDYPARLAAMAAAPPLAGRAQLLGHREDLAEIWPELSLLVHAAEAEPFGRVVAEAQAAGLAVLGRAEGGLPEIVDEGETGRLVPPDDPAALARALAEMLAEPERLAAMGRAGRQRAARFAPARHARAIEAVYDSLLGPGSALRSEPR